MTDPLPRTKNMDEALRELTVEQVEAFRRENTVSMEPPLEDWAVEENRILDAMCDIARAALAGSVESPQRAEPVAWLAEEQGGEGKRELWWYPNKHSRNWKFTPLYAQKADGVGEGG